MKIQKTLFSLITAMSLFLFVAACSKTTNSAETTDSNAEKTSSGIEKPVSDDLNNSTEQLHNLFKSEWERGLKENPVTASFRGDKRYNHLWSDLSVNALANSQRQDEQALKKIHLNAI